MSELIIYQSDDGLARVQFRSLDGSLWLTQLQLAELYGVTVANINIHLRKIVQDGELASDTVIKQDLITASDGKRYATKLYRLDMVLAVGYRVRSVRGTQFRQWATAHLTEYLVKGFVMDDERLKNPGGWNYFDELLARIREIRASDKRFYQKVRELFALSSDYQADEQTAQLFLAEVQNKRLYAVTQRTAAEIIRDRADASAPNMGLTSWVGSRVRKADVIVARNYLNADEVDTLNRLVVIFLEQAELRAKDRLPLTLDYWRQNVDRLLAFNDKPILQGSGKLSNERARQIAHERYDSFDTQRRQAEALAADAQDLKTLEAVAEKGKKKTREAPIVVRYLSEVQKTGSDVCLPRVQDNLLYLSASRFNELQRSVIAIQASQAGGQNQLHGRPRLSAPPAGARFMAVPGWHLEVHL